MADKLKNGIYRILYAQPSPETGERVAVALLVEEGHRASVYFDRRFPRLKKFFGDLELDALEFYLEDLKKAVSESTQTESVLNAYAPQIVPSDARRIALPLDERALSALMKKLLQPPTRLTSSLIAVAAVDPVTKAIEAYMKIRAGVTKDVQIDVTSADVFGEPVQGLHSVALGIKTGSTWVLVDGVDLNQLTPKGAIKRADEVGRNFWQFSREAEKQQDLKIKRIGLVLNGNSHLRPATLDAHDYSLHRLTADADHTFDGSSAAAPEQIRLEVLRGTS